MHTVVPVQIRWGGQITFSKKCVIAAWANTSKWASVLNPDNRTIPVHPSLYKEEGGHLVSGLIHVDRSGNFPLVLLTYRKRRKQTWLYLTGLRKTRSHSVIR